MDKSNDLERAHPTEETRNEIFRQNKQVFDFFEKNPEERRFFIMNGVFHQTLFAVGLLMCCGYLVSNQMLLMVLFDENPIRILIIGFAIFCLFNLFCTRSLR